MKLKKLAAFIIAGVLALTALAGCGASDSGEGGGGNADGKTTITIFNTKSEITEYLEAAAEKYEAGNNVHIEVYISNDTVSAHLSTKYASSDPYTINMVDAKDVYSVGAQYGADLSGEEWVKDTDYAISVGGKVIGFPVCVEARGLLYNADAIEAVTGEAFDPASIRTLDDLAPMCGRLVAGGMETPTAILKPDWSLAAHFIQQVYEEREDVEGFVQDLYAGNVGLMPVPQNLNDAYTGCIVGGGSKYFYIDDSEYTTGEERQAAKDFLNWLVYSEDGQVLVSDTCGMVSAFSNNNVPCSNHLGAAVKEFVDAGTMIPNYDYDPDDHISKVGAEMQRYLAGQCDRAALAQSIEAYWASTTPVEH